MKNACYIVFVFLTILVIVTRISSKIILWCTHNKTSLEKTSNLTNAASSQTKDQSLTAAIIAAIHKYRKTH